MVFNRSVWLLTVNLRLCWNDFNGKSHTIKRNLTIHSTGAQVAFNSFKLYYLGFDRPTAAILCLGLS